MKPQTTPARVQEYRPQREKDFATALKQFIATEFPRLGGPKIRDLFVTHIMDFIATYFPEKTQVSKGTLSWVGVDRTDRPSKEKPIEATKLRPILLPLITPEDITEVIEGTPARERLKKRIARVLTCAYQGGVVLTYNEVALLFTRSRKYVAKLIREYEQQHRTVLPCRATIHDLGPKVSHKALICQNHVIEGKMTPEIAKETNHSPDAVDRYLLDDARYQFCRRKGMSIKEAAYSTGLSPKLAAEYEEIFQNLNKTSENRRE